MRLTPVSAMAAALLLAALPATAYEQTFADPGVVVSAPGLGGSPALKVELHAEAVPQADSTRICAGRFLRELIKRPDMPDRDRIYRAPLDQANFLVLYILEAEGRKTLHAHLLGALRGSQCLEAHFSRPMQSEDEAESWRRSFAGASLRAAPGR